MLARPVPRVRGPTLTAAALASDTTPPETMLRAAIERVPSLAQRSTRAQTPRSTSSTTTRKPPDASAMGPGHSSGSYQHASVLVTFQGRRGHQRPWDRSRRKQGGRRRAIRGDTPLSPPEGSSSWRWNLPSVKKKCTPASARTSRSLAEVHVDHVEITLRLVDPTARVLVNLRVCAQKSITAGGKH